MEALETKAQVTSDDIKFYLSMKTRKRGKPHGNKTSPQNGHGAKNMKVNGSHHNTSLTPRSDLN